MRVKVLLVIIILLLVIPGVYACSGEEISCAEGCLSPHSGIDFSPNEYSANIAQWEKCTVDNDQSIVLDDINGVSYFAKEIIVNAKLDFRTNSWSYGSLTSPCTPVVEKYGYTLNGGNGGGKGGWDNCGSGGGGGAGSGGGGAGDLCIRGEGSINADHQSDGGGAGVSAPDFAGALVSFYAYKIDIAGTLTSKGDPGNNGNHAHDDDTVGYGGSGGAGGSGGGIIILNSADIQVSGTIDVSGGKGGEGGKSNNEDGETCKSCDSGGAGGGGGGGANGFVITTQSITGVTCNGGVGGKGGCDGLLDPPVNSPSAGYPGTNGDFLPSCIIQNSAVEMCNNGQDDDFDGFVDMEDYDCYETQAKAATPPWVDEGPYTFNRDDGVGNQLIGEKTADIKNSLPNFDKSASDGRDAVCGDDGKFCYYDGPTTIDHCEDISLLGSDPKNDCESVPGCTYVPGSGTDYCEGTFCYRECSPDDQFCQGCDQEADCEAFFSDETSCDGEGGCDWIDASADASCEGVVTIPDCAAYTDAASCGADATGYCEWYDGYDQGYVTSDKRYYCSQDYIENPETIFYPGAVGTLWDWWDAYAYLSSYKIHVYDNHEYISNGKEWFVCNANEDLTTSDTNAKLVGEGEFIEKATSNDGYSCADVLNSDLLVFSEQIPFGLCDDQITTQQKNCCVTTSGDLPGYTLGQTYKSQCNKQCYVDYMSGGSKTSVTDYFTSTSKVFETIYCDKFPLLRECWAAGGFDDVDLLNINPVTGGLVPADMCGFSASCLGDAGNAIDLTKNCVDISFDRTNDGGATFTYKGFVCSKDAATPKVCGTGDYLITKDTVDVPDDICCIGIADSGDPCVSITPFGELSCEEQGGEWMVDTTKYFCNPSGYVIEGDGGNCCLGGKWRPTFSTLLSNVDLTQPESYYCYESQDKSRFAECCTSFSSCVNSLDGALFSGTQFQSKYFGYYVKGGVLHTLENYDKEDITTGKIVNYVNVANIEKGDPFTLPLSEAEFDVWNPQDWSSFTHLKFDIAYNLDYPLYLIISNDNDPETGCTIYLQDELLNGNSTYRWHRASIDLYNKCTGNNLIDFSNVKNIYIATNYEAIDYPISNFAIAVDQFHLSGTSPSAPGTNTESKYCTGDFGKWIENLDGGLDDNGDPTGLTSSIFNEGFTEAAAFENYGLYWYACDSQPSFKWTGRACCGDDTEAPYSQTGSQGEYYADLDMGCYHGVPVGNGQTVGYALNDFDYEDILYYVDTDGLGAFHRCGDNDRNEDIMYTPGTSKGDLIVEHRDTNGIPLAENQVHKEFSIIGDYMCYKDELDRYYWRKKSEVTDTRLLATKMYEFTFGTRGYDTTQFNTFDLFCEDFSKVTTLTNDEIIALGIDTLKSSIGQMCVLSIKEELSDGSNSRNNVLLGFKINKPIGEFLNDFGTYAANNGLITEGQKADFATICDDVESSVIENNVFFGACDNPRADNDLRFTYNPSNGLVLVSYVDKISDWNSIFKTRSLSDFFRSFWDGFTNVFAKWFGEGDALGGQSVLAGQGKEQIVLPSFQKENARLEKLYIGKNYNGDTGKKIIALIEVRPDMQIDPADWPEYLTIEYDGFKTNMLPLARYFMGDTQENLELLHVVSRDGKRQTIQLVNPTNHYEYEKAKPFDWRKITTAFEFDNKEKRTSADSEWKEGQFCDDQGNADPLDDVFRYNNNLCEFWDSTAWSSGIMGCTTDGTLDDSNCQPLCTPACNPGYFCDGTSCQPSPCDPACDPLTEVCDGGVCVAKTAACLDGILDSGEECDDGNGVNTDSCTNSCTRAVCGDNIVRTLPVRSAEECDDGNTQDGDGCSHDCKNEDPGTCLCKNYPPINVHDNLCNGGFGPVCNPDVTCQCELIGS